jgi:hypothetical protein
MINRNFLDHIFKYFQHPHACEDFGCTYKGLFFRRVAFARHNVPWFLEWCKLFNSEVQKIFPEFNELSTTPWRRMGECMYTSTFLGLGTSWRWVVNFTLRPLYPRGKSPRYPVDRRLGGPQSRSERLGEKKILDPTGTRTPTSPPFSP